VNEPTPEPTPPADAANERRARRQAYIWTLLLVAFVVILIVLAAANTRRVTISWAVADAKTPLVFIVVAAGILGWLAGIATSAIIRHRAHHRTRRDAGPPRTQRQ
jgi:uncharacterized integral membrane protein